MDSSLVNRIDRHLLHAHLLLSSSEGFGLGAHPLERSDEKHARHNGIGEHCENLLRRLTDRAKAAGDSPAGARVVDASPCPPGHNTPLPLERSPPASFKRLLGSCFPA